MDNIPSVLEKPVQLEPSVSIDLTQQPQVMYKSLVSNLDSAYSSNEVQFTGPMYSLGSTEMSRGGITSISSYIYTNKVSLEGGNENLRSEFNITSEFDLPIGTYVSDEQATEMARLLDEHRGHEGYTAKYEKSEGGARRIVVQTPENHPFHISVGYTDEYEAYHAYASLQDEHRSEKKGSLFEYCERYKEAIKNGNHKSRISLSIGNSHPSFGPSGIPFEPSEGQIPEKYFSFWLYASKQLTEDISGVLKEVIGEERQQDSSEPTPINWSLTKRSSGI
jgi:hypothetical protein